MTAELGLGLILGIGHMSPRLQLQYLPPSPPPPPSAAADVGLNQIKLEKLNSAQFNHYFYDFALIAKSSISSRTERIELMDETTKI